MLILFRGYYVNKFFHVIYTIFVNVIYATFLQGIIIYLMYRVNSYPIETSHEVVVIYQNLVNKFLLYHKL